MNFYRSCIASASDFAPSYSAQVNGNIFQTSFKQAFIGNSSFNSAVIVGNNVIDCTEAFKNCTNLNQPVTFADSPNNINCEGMFDGCRKLNSSIVINRQITSADNMFRNCGNLRAVVINKLVSSADNMFRDSGLERNLNLELAPSASFNNIFTNCLLLNHDITLRGVPAYNGTELFANLRYLHKNINFLNANNCVRMFNGCNSLVENVYVGGTYAKNCYEMFAGCSNLQSIAVDNISDFEYMFKGCSNLTQVSLTNIGEGLSARGLFSDCTSFNQAFSTNFISCERMFENCRSLNQNITTHSYCLNYDNAFKNCISLNQDLVIEQSQSMRYMFDGCTNLSKVKLNFNVQVPGPYYGMFLNKNMSRLLTIQTKLPYGQEVYSFLSNMSKVIMGDTAYITWSQDGGGYYNSQYLVRISLN